MTSFLEALETLLPASSIHHPSTPSYRAQSLPWSAHLEAHPKLVITPTTLPVLSAVVRHLYSNPTLDFAVRNTGTGGASAPDVILSMHGFKDFHFDAASETAILGAGLDWSEAEELMAQHAPGWALVGARCGWVGVAGGALVGGYSWLSHEFGLISDPQNLLDVQVVLGDGRVVWAFEEDPELLWGMRGGGGNFGVVVALKMRARRYVSEMFAGLVFLPYERLGEVGRWTAEMVERKGDPKLAFAVTNQGPGMGVPPQGRRPGIAVMMFDAHGEEHARSKEVGFGELFEMEGLKEVACGMCPVSGMTKMADSYRCYQGVNNFWGSAPLVNDVDERLIERAWNWYEKSLEVAEGLDQGSTVLFEFMQEVCGPFDFCKGGIVELKCSQGFFDSSGSHNASAWPHSGRSHIMQVVLGCDAQKAPAGLEDLVQKRLSQVEAEIIGADKATGRFHAGFLHEWNDYGLVFGDSLGKLKALKQKYDPQNRFNKSVDLVGEGKRVKMS